MIEKGTGRVQAVFRSVVYCRHGDGLVAVTDSEVEPGPINLQTDIPGSTGMRRFGIIVGQKTFLSNHMLQIANLRVNLGNVSIWSPPRARHLSSGALRLGLQRLSSTTLNPSSSGLGVQGWEIPEVRTQMDHWLADVMPGLPVQNSADWAVPLIGRGPGLTPSGDDFLGGVMIALCAAGKGDAAQNLWNTIQDRAFTDTNEISHALLSAAAKGQGSASLHRAMNALIDGGRDLDTALALVARIGHSSGWDALAGIQAVLSAYTDLAADHAA
ncbi:MAG: DUF2877 domain-containing protein [Silicimonas sp.]|nr:DUF2877 domain-containing protein [Silicimonas sp.]